MSVYTDTDHRALHERQTTEDIPLKYGNMGSQYPLYTTHRKPQIEYPISVDNRVIIIQRFMILR